MENIALRDSRAADGIFLAELFYQDRSADFINAGLSEMQLKPLLAMQFQAQKQSYELAYPNAENQIIECGGKSIGRILTDRNGGKIHLIDIVLLKDFRGRGIGGMLIEKLQIEAKQVNLSAFKTNAGAIRLYEKYGFAVTADEGMYLQMEWKNVG